MQAKLFCKKNEHVTLLEYQIEAFHCAPRARKQQQARSPPDGEQLAMVLERLSTSIVQHCTCTRVYTQPFSGGVVTCGAVVPWLKKCVLRATQVAYVAALAVVELVVE